MDLVVRNDTEFAILIPQATNLGLLSVAKNAGRPVRTFDDLDEPLVWLLPLTNAWQLQSLSYRTYTSSFSRPIKSFIFGTSSTAPTPSDSEKVGAGRM
jgi:hypothetical protein